MKEDEDLKSIIAFTVGYMLKVLKNKKDISDVRNEFNSIRHGNYNEFLKLIDAELPIFVLGGEGKAPQVFGKGNKDEEIVLLANECDMIQLISSANAMRTFLKKCFLKHGNFEDPDIKDSVYNKLAIFEIRIRVHASNYGLITINDTLESIINKLCEKLEFNSDILDKLHKGRRFLNKVKHNKSNYYLWSKNLTEFEIAYDILTEKEIRLI